MGSCQSCVPTEADRVAAARYGPTVKGHESKIKALFKKIDKDGNGYLVVGELRDVVSRYTGEAFDEKQFFGWFDVHGRGGEPDCQLDLQEFGWYLADICESFDEPLTVMPSVIQKFEELMLGPEEKRYGPIIEGQEAAIQELFKKIDKDGNGYLVAGELKGVVSKYSGVPFDEVQFFDWFDVHGKGGKPDSQLDLKEFGWYVADIAEGFPDPKGSVGFIVKDLSEKCS